MIFYNDLIKNLLSFSTEGESQLSAERFIGVKELKSFSAAAFDLFASGETFGVEYVLNNGSKKIKNVNRTSTIIGTSKNLCTYLTA